MVVPWPFIILAFGWQVAKAIGTGEMRMRGGRAIREDETRAYFGQ
jgi:hypothetical protein